MCASLHASVASASWRNAPLHVCEANASLTKQWIYVILNSKDGDIMANDKLAEQSMDFAVQIINLVKQLKEQRESIMSNQIGRSGTSIGANIHEANYAASKADFINKFHIALKECGETEYWIEMLVGSNAIIEQTAKELLQECGVIRRMLVKSITTAKENA